jgi:signal transduction histidine kinase
MFSESEGTIIGSTDRPDLLQTFEHFTLPGTNPLNYVVVTQQPLADLLAQTNDLRNRTFTLFAGVILVIGVVIWLGTRSIVQPLQELATASAAIPEAMSKGKFDATVPVINRIDEIGNLSRALNVMSRELQSLYRDMDQRVKARTSELATVARISSAATQILDLHLLIAEIVFQMYNSFGFQRVDIFLAPTDEANPTLLASLADPSVTSEDALATRASRERRVATLTVGNIITQMALPLILGDKLLGVLEVCNIPISPAEGRILITLADQIAVTIHNAQQYETQVKVAEEMCELDQLKSRFLANMSHELRTPLNSILNNTYFVLEGIYGEVNDEQIDALTMVHRSGKDLLALINDLLDLTKIESGMMELFIQDDVDVKALLQEVYDTGSSLIQDNGPKLVSEFEPGLPDIVSVDKQRLKQILLNLVSNAVKFTPAEGTVTLGAYYRNENLTFFVRDTGVGIADEDRDLIFQPFKQTKEGLKKAASTGLGLPISKALVEKHGGRLWLESKVGEGSIFFVSVPVGVLMAVS